jgi:linoleoyl-CoA desaturase
MHHTYTNVDGVDHDIGYGVLRIFPEQKWEPRFLANPLMAAILAVTFEWTLSLQSLELEKVMAGEKTWAEVRKQLPPMFAKMRKQFAKDYVFFPLIAGPMFLPVIAGNFTANLIRNVWAFSIIFCGHFTEDAEMFPKEVLENETRGHWYLRQLRGSSNLTGGTVMHIMSGNLSHQIEHHMFPDIPGMRYAEMSVKVREICEKYGQHYNTGSFRKQFSTVVGRIFKGALPNFGQKVQASAETAVARLAEVVPVSKPARRKSREAIAA